MRKGDLTRQTILSRAVSHPASQLGLEGLSIGLLANTLNLSRAACLHTSNQEALQIQVSMQEHSSF
jgi:hypothetical protein